MTAPVGSRTLPRITPLAVCASARDVHARWKATPRIRYFAEEKVDVVAGLRGGAQVGAAVPPGLKYIPVSACSPQSRRGLGRRHGDETRLGGGWLQLELPLPDFV